MIFLFFTGKNDAKLFPTFTVIYNVLLGNIVTFANTQKYAENYSF